MDYIISTLKKNELLLKDISNHSAISEMFMGILRNIERTIPEDYRQQYYYNLSCLRIVLGEKTECSLNAPVVVIDEKLLKLADLGYVGEHVSFKDSLLEELYHELLHLASTDYRIDSNNNVFGYSGFIVNRIDHIISNSVFNGLTEGFTQYLTIINTDLNMANYDVQVECAKKLVELVGIDVVKQCYFNNSLGMKPIFDKLEELGVGVDFLYNLEEKCHVEVIQHLVGNFNEQKEGKQSL